MRFNQLQQQHFRTGRFSVPVFGSVDSEFDIHFTLWGIYEALIPRCRQILQDFIKTLKIIEKVNRNEKHVERQNKTRKNLVLDRMDIFQKFVDTFCCIYITSRPKKAPYKIINMRGFVDCNKWMIQNPFNFQTRRHPYAFCPNISRHILEVCP